MTGRLGVRRMGVGAYLTAEARANVDITWIRDEFLVASSTPHAPGVLAAETVEESALTQFAELAASVPASDSDHGVGT